MVLFAELGSIQRSLTENWHKKAEKFLKIKGIDHMEKLSNAANKYYSELEVLGIRDRISSFWYWSFIFNAAAFIICVFLATKEICVNPNWTYVIITGIFEILMFFSKYKFRHKFEKLILKRGSEKYCVEFESTLAYKRFLLKSFLEGKNLNILNLLRKLIKHCKFT
jgi:hypothetical protein